MPVASKGGRLAVLTLAASTLTSWPDPSAQPRRRTKAPALASYGGVNVKVSAKVDPCQTNLPRPRWAKPCPRLASGDTGVLTSPFCKHSSVAWRIGLTTRPMASPLYSTAFAARSYHVWSIILPGLLRTVLTNRLGARSGGLGLSRFYPGEALSEVLTRRLCAK